MKTQEVVGHSSVFHSSTFSHKTRSEHNVTETVDDIVQNRVNQRSKILTSSNSPCKFSQMSTGARAKADISAYVEYATISTHIQEGQYRWMG